MDEISGLATLPSDFSIYRHFTRAEWAALRADTQCAMGV